MADGTITINTELNTKNFDKDYKRIEHIVDKERDLDFTITYYGLPETEEQLEKVIEKKRQLDESIAKTGYMSYDSSGIQNFVNSYETSREKAERLKDETAQAKQQAKELADKQKETAKEVERASNNAKHLADGFRNAKSSISDAASKIGKISASNISKGFKDMGSSIQKSIVKVGKLALAIFGIRSAYNFLRRASSELASYDKQYAANLEYIRFVMTQAVAPVLRYIVNLAGKLLGYIAAVVKALFGVDLLANSTAKDFSKMKSDSIKTGKAVKEIKKQLAGFDEINMLSSTDTSTGGGAGGGAGSDITMPNLDMEPLKVDILGWLEWLAEQIKNFDWTALGEKISDVLLSIDYSRIFTDVVTVFGEAILGIQDMFLAIDWPAIFKKVGSALVDALKLVNDYINFIKFDEIGKKLSDTFIAIPWAELGSTIINLLWDSLEGIVDLFLGIDWGEVAKTISDAILDWTGTIIDRIDEVDWQQLGKDIMDRIIDFIANIDWIMVGQNILEGLGKGILAVISIIIGVFESIVKKILEFLGIHSPSKLFEGIGKNIIKGMVNGIKNVISTVVNVFKTIWSKIKGVFSSVVSWFKEKFQKAWNGIKSVFSNVGTFFGNIWKTIKKKFTDIGTKAGNVVGSAFKKVINTVLGAIENILNSPIRAINGLIDSVNKLPGVNVGKLNTFSLPRLKSGAIINMPNKGRLVGNGSAIGGESGREGILPLTDQQAMAELGREIGKNVLVNLTNITSMNGRILSKELKKVQSDHDFAYNT